MYIITLLTLQHKTEVTKIDDSLIGGNASLEQQAVAMDEESGQSGIDVVLANRLQETGFNKKSYQVYIKVSEVWTSLHTVRVQVLTIRRKVLQISKYN